MPHLLAKVQSRCLLSPEAMPMVRIRKPEAPKKAKRSHLKGRHCTGKLCSRGVTISVMRSKYEQSRLCDM